MKPVLRKCAQTISLVGMMALVGCASHAPGRRSASVATLGQTLPDLPLRDAMSGQPLSLKSLSGQVVLLDIWASWCAPCKEELPLLDEMAGRLGESGVKIVAVSIDDDPEAMKDFLRQKKDWRLQLAHDPLRKIPDALQPEKMPTSYVLDRGGALRKIHGGFSRDDIGKLEAELKDLAKP